MSLIPSDEDDVIDDEDLSNEFDDVPLTDTDVDEDEMEEEE